MCSKVYSKLIKIYNIPFWTHCEEQKKTKRRASNNLNCTRNHPARVSHEHGFRILKSIGVGLWARWSPRPPPQPRDASEAHLLAHSRALWFDLHRFLVYILRTFISASVLIGARSEMHPHNRTSENALARSWNSIHILGTAAGLPKAIGFRDNW